MHGNINEFNKGWHMRELSTGYVR